MFWLPIILATIVSCTNAQQTAQTRVASHLSECYNNVTLINRNNLPPVTVQVLIDIIRKIEDNANVNMDLRQIAAVLLHTYRQDGIEYHQPENTLASSNVLPFAPTFHSFHRHRLLLTRLIPNNLATLSDDTLSSVLKCTIHHMLSTTVDGRVRGDENSCNQLAQYRVLRTARSARSINEDVEILQPVRTVRRNANKNYNPKDDVDYSNFGDVMSERQIAESTCPLLDGVIYTDWGAVSAGHLIAGIAAGASPQQVDVMQLVGDSALNYRNVQQTVNSIYPATFSGDLAEAVLIQGTERGSTSISIGTAGNWNSTEAPRYFMLHNRNNLEMTDPEIRGDIDGFVLGSRISSLLSTYSSLKLSTLLDMYYSPVNGAFDPELRACNRRTLSQNLVTNANLVSETLAFAAALDTNMPLRGTIIRGLDTLANSAVTNLQSYTSSNLNDMNCVTTLSGTRDSRLRTSLYIVLDSTWQYQTVYPAISYLADQIEVSPFGSNITILSAFDGSVVINTTSSIADFHAEYTNSRHTSMLAGVNLETSLTNIRQTMQQKLDEESIRGYVGGASTVLLYLINSGNLQNNERVWEQARLLNETVPDLRILFATSTNQYDHLWNLVRDMHNDIHTISLNSAGTNLDIIMSPVLQRIQNTGRRIINPFCGSTYTAQTYGTRQFNDYVEPGFINFYTLHPNYFYEHRDNRKVRITRSSSGSGSLIICHSRVVAQPRQNSTEVGLDQNAIICETLTSTGSIEILLQNACDDYSTINTCPSLHISVQSNSALTTSVSASCTDLNCRFPYDIRYQVQVEELGCFSGASSFTASLLFVLAALYVTLYGTL